jgi:hypothetical protein
MKRISINKEGITVMYGMKSNNGLYNIAKCAWMIIVADLLNLLSRKWEL